MLEMVKTKRLLFLLLLLSMWVYMDNKRCGPLITIVLMSYGTILTHTTTTTTGQMPIEESSTITTLFQNILNHEVLEWKFCFEKMSKIRIMTMRGARKKDAIFMPISKYKNFFFLSQEIPKNIDAWCFRPSSVANER